MRATPETYLGFAHAVEHPRMPAARTAAGRPSTRRQPTCRWSDFALNGRWLAAAEYVHHARGDTQVAGGLGRASLPRQVGLPGGRFR